MLVLSSIVITSSGKEGAGRFAGRVIVYPHFVVSRLFYPSVLPLGAKGSVAVLDCGTTWISFQLVSCVLPNCV